MNNFLDALNPDVNAVTAHFYLVLQKSWSKESCWPPLQMQWHEGNPSLGNCLVSVLALWAATGFQGEVVPGLAKQPGKDKPDWHFFIRFCEVDVDLTRQQFLVGTDIKVLEPGDLIYDTVIKGSIFDEAENRNLRMRLRLLLQNLHENGYVLSKSANEIIDKLEQKFTALPPVNAQRSL